MLRPLWFSRVLLFLGITACAAPAAPSTPTSLPPTPAPRPTVSPTPVSGPPQVILKNFAFRPAELEVAVGTTVEWINQEESASHTVTSGTPDYPSGVFDSGRLRPGDSFRFTFQQPGTYEYFCAIHSRMRGRIIVKPAP
ncbi:plastocyanin/azurin family copper-binding protein [Thermoflexus sp.]|uniref:cupredoxin domain-containing protein n=1 Tax=Thermoflexus sp. TaxID=1969742 RepID=UPI0035E4429F